MNGFFDRIHRASAVAKVNVGIVKVFHIQPLGNLVPVIVTKWEIMNTVVTYVHLRKRMRYLNRPG